MNQRIDKWLVYARFVKHRGKAQAMIEAGQVRINRERVTKTSTNVRASDVLTVALGGRVKVVRVLSAAERRGSASDARQLYEELASSQVMDALAKPV